MTIDQEWLVNQQLRDLAAELLDSGWRSKRKRDWTDEERAAYQRRSKEEWKRQVAERIARGEPLKVEVLSYEQAQDQRAGSGSWGPRARQAPDEPHDLRCCRR